MKTIEEISKEAQELKAKYPVNYTLTVPINDDETEFASIILRKIDRMTFKAARKLMETDPLTATEMLIKNLYIGGDSLDLVLPKDEQQKFDILRAADPQLSDMLKVREASLKKN